MSLSVIILSYNVKDLLRNAISAVYKTYKSKDLQIIVVDNASSDGSVKMVRKEFPAVDIVVSKTNTGFSKGNNLARKIAKGNIILFLNPDTEVQKGAIKKSIEKLVSNKKLGAITCKVLLPNGMLDYSCHRGLPSPWNTFSYLSGLSNIFPKSKFFSGYSATYLDYNKSHYIDCVSGTFLMIKKEVLEKIDWWDEDYWWNGEDIEMCYRIKKEGFRIWYESSVTMIHYKGSSSGLWSTTKIVVPKETKIRSAKSATLAMRIFLNKHWREMGPWPLMQLMRLGIYSLEKYRLGKIGSGKLYK
jgi:GT2 family glycosyltransferase